MTQLKGIDISHFQAEPNYAVLAKNVQVVYNKATEGNTYVDPNVVARVPKLKAAGLHVGVYHFARFANVIDAKAEAQHFINTVKPFDHLIDMPYALDIEVDDAKLSIADLTAACVAFIEEVKAAFKKPVAVYTYDSFIGANLSKELGKYPLWLADYGDHKLAPNGVWKNFTALQYSDKGRVLGLNGGVDIDWFDSSMVIAPPVPNVVKITHKVVSGDTLSEIAVHYKTTVAALQKLNGLKDADMIQLGSVLKIN